MLRFEESQPTRSTLQQQYPSIRQKQYVPYSPQKNHRIQTPPPFPQDQPASLPAQQITIWLAVHCWWYLMDNKVDFYWRCLILYIAVYLLVSCMLREEIPLPWSKRTTVCFALLGFLLGWTVKGEGFQCHPLIRTQNPRTGRLTLNST